MRGGKRQGRKAKLAATENKQSRINQWSRPGGVLLMTQLVVNDTSLPSRPVPSRPVPSRQNIPEHLSLCSCPFSRSCPCSRRCLCSCSCPCSCSWGEALTPKNFVSMFLFLSLSCPCSCPWVRPVLRPNFFESLFLQRPCSCQPPISLYMPVP